jgi:large repetitive protein
MNVRRAALLLLLAASVGGAFFAVDDHGSAEAAKTPATCVYLFTDSSADNSRGWTFGPE